MLIRTVLEPEEKEGQSERKVVHTFPRPILPEK